MRPSPGTFPLTAAARPCDALSMRPRSFLLIAAAVLAAALAFAAPAAADELNPGSGDAGQITSVNSGVTEMSLENIFVLGFDKRGDVENFRMSLFVGPTVRYFVARNAVLGVNVSFFYKVEDGQQSRSDLGGLFSLHIGYMLNLSGGMFLKPLIGAGAFYGERKQEIPGAGTVTSSIFGGIIRGGMPIFFYSNSRVNLFAGPEAIISLGGSTSQIVAGVEVEGDFFATIDGGFNVGISYVF